MPIDFTIKTYTNLLRAAIYAGNKIISFEDYLVTTYKYDKIIILRHDVDKKPENALRMAALENRLGIKASYYFRTVKASFNEDMIKKIAGMGHEIGYHYENLSLCQGNYELAIMNFELDLQRFRKIYPVKTICMHGSPRSRFNNIDLWKNYNYRDYGIIGEPYLDVNFDEVFYITDTGRRWDGYKVSIRDKVNNRYIFPIHTTLDFIKYIESDMLPNQIMITVHPQRWEDNIFSWTKEFIWQNAKNVVKRRLAVK